MTQETRLQAQVLIGAHELAALLATGAAVHLLDVRWRLGDPHGRQAYLAGHLPGAVFVDLDTELAGPPGPRAGRHPLPDPLDLQAAVRRWGLRTGVPVVVLDAVGGMSAARAWWLLRWAGLPDVRILDGGLDAWVGAGGRLSTDEPVPDPGDVVLAPGSAPVLTADEVTGFVAAGGLLLDARAAGRYRGEPFPADPRPGHVPGAVSAPTADTLDADGRFLDPAVLARRWRDLGAVPGRPVAVYCGSGVTAAHLLAALEIGGITGAALYPGSWSQWAADPDRPTVTGDSPG